MKAGLKKIALLGTKVAMEEDFLKGRLERKHGLEVLVLAEEIWDQMNDAIFQELPKDIITEKTKKMFVDAPGGVNIPLFDTVELHARGAAKWAVEN
ncbi:hypothetical protein GQ53DRAFT_818803 [Thozetella sp. PMI_491]|nr:hypothetical protein GQ53DRAFT_818803 [Thozetella sp. PMI_491]